MSAMEMRDFGKHFEMYSYAEQLATIEYLIKLMRKKQEQNSKDDGFSGSAEDRAKLDAAISEMERGEYDTYNNFDDFLAEIADES